MENVEKDDVIKEMMEQLKLKKQLEEKDTVEKKSDPVVKKNPEVESKKKRVYTNQSPHWKRIDVKQKKVTRGLSQLAKSFINKWLLADKERKDNFFMHLDNLLINYFPSIHQSKRIETLGGIGKIILMIRFEREIESSRYLSHDEKEQILEYGAIYTHFK